MRLAAIGLCDPGYSEESARAQHTEAVADLRRACGEVIDAGLQPDEIKSAAAMASLVKQHADAPFTALVLMQAAWSRPAAVLQAIRAFPTLPMLLLAPGSPVKSGVIHSTAPIAGVTATVPTLRRHGIKFKLVWSMPGKPIDAKEYMPFLHAAQTVQRLRGAKLAMIGFGDMRLQTTGFDVQEIHEKFGVEVESLDMLELKAAMDAMPKAEVESQRAALTGSWSHSGEAKVTDALRKQAIMYLVLSRWAKDRNYAGFSIKCPTGVAAVMGMTPCLAGCLLARTMPYVCENDIPGLLGQLALGTMSNQISAYWEFYEMLEDGILLGCCGFSPEAMLAEPLKVRFYDSFVTGAACCSRIRTGPYTLARLGKDTANRFVLSWTEGEAHEPPAWCEEALGAPQHPSVRFVPEVPADQFVRNVLAQHVAVSAGRWAAEMAEFANILDIARV
jgi:L-fucose isomerase-like protein